MYKQNKTYQIRTIYLLAKRGDNDASIKLLESLLRVREKDYLYVVLATVYLSIGNVKDAINSCKKAIKLKKGNHKAYYLLVKSYYSMGLLKKAIESLQSAIAIKRERFNSDYIACVKLLEEIEIKVDENYKDDENLLKSLEVTSKRYKGRIKKYIPQKAYGFIECREIGDVFFHASNCKFAINEGVIVFFFEESSKRKVAKNIKALKS